MKTIEDAKNEANLLLSAGWATSVKKWKGEDNDEDDIDDIKDAEKMFKKGYIFIKDNCSWELYTKEFLEAVCNYANNGDETIFLTCLDKEYIGSVSIPYFRDGIQIKSGIEDYNVIFINNAFYLEAEDGRLEEIKKPLVGRRYIKSFGESNHKSETFEINIENFKLTNRIEQFKKFYNESEKK